MAKCDSKTKQNNKLPGSLLSFFIFFYINRIGRIKKNDDNIKTLKTKIEEGINRVFMTIQNITKRETETLRVKKIKKIVKC